MRSEVKTPGREDEIVDEAELCRASARSAASCKAFADNLTLTLGAIVSVVDAGRVRLLSRSTSGAVCFLTAVSTL